MTAVVARRPVRGPHDYEEYALPSELEALRSSPRDPRPTSQWTERTAPRHAISPRILPFPPTRPPPVPLRSRPRECAPSPATAYSVPAPPCSRGPSPREMTVVSPSYGGQLMISSAPPLPRQLRGPALRVDTGTVYYGSGPQSIEYHVLEHRPSPYDMATVGTSPGYTTAPNVNIFSPRPTSPPPNAHQAYPSSSSTVNSTTSVAPPLTHPFPSTQSLRLTSLRLDDLSDIERIGWAQDVYRLVDRYSRPHQEGSGASLKAHRISGPAMDLLNLSLPIIISSTMHTDRAVSAPASYLKGMLLSSGICPDYLPKDPRQAFKEFENAARGGEHRGWFRLGRDYESVGDPGRAKECLERGVKRGDCESTYRMGMAHLLGQLDLAPDSSLAIPLLYRAAESSSIDSPHPAYVYGMLLAGELELPPTLPAIPAHLLGPNPDVRTSMARQNIEKAAYLCHPPAQYKCGFLYEHAALGFAYDPLMSVQWYSLASQGGEVEADMALSKWFLCGAEGNFGKNEDLARTFAEKAARKGHPNGCFAMGYYFELGIGGRRDMDQARKWYHRAAKLNNTDAIARLSALSAPQPTTFSLAEHQARISDTLIRKRTLARIRSERQGSPQPLTQRQDEERVWRDTQRAARAQHHHDSPGRNGYAMSPTPRVGEIISPLVFQAPRLGPSSPTRRPIPHQAFSMAYGDTTSSSSASACSYPSSRAEPVQREEYWDNGRTSPAGPRTVVNEGKRWDSGPQTFAEMGFVSKPVEDEGCVVM